MLTVGRNSSRSGRSEHRLEYLLVLHFAGPGDCEDSNWLLSPPHNFGASHDASLPVPFPEARLAATRKVSSKASCASRRRIARLRGRPRHFGRDDGLAVGHEYDERCMHAPTSSESYTRVDRALRIHQRESI
jgi:hypothetical protein